MITTQNTPTLTKRKNSSFEALTFLVFYTILLIILGVLDIIIFTTKLKFKLISEPLNNILFILIGTFTIIIAHLGIFYFLTHVRFKKRAKRILKKDITTKPPPSTVTAENAPNLFLFMFTFLLIPVLEELIFRGIILQLLLVYGPILSIFIVSVCFSLNHTHYGKMGILQQFISGLILGTLFWLSDLALIVPLMTHLGVNFFSLILTGSRRELSQ